MASSEYPCTQIISLKKLQKNYLTKYKESNKFIDLLVIFFWTSE